MTRKTIRFDDTLISEMDSIVREINEGKLWDKISLSDVVRHGAFLMVAALGKQGSRLRKRNRYRWYTRYIDAPKQVILNLVPIVDRWHEIVKGATESDESS